MNIFKAPLSILLSIYTEVEFLDDKIVLFLIFWETAILFSVSAVQFYILMTKNSILCIIMLLFVSFFLCLILPNRSVFSKAGASGFLIFHSI